MTLTTRVHKMDDEKRPNKRKMGLLILCKRYSKCNFLQSHAGYAGYVNHYRRWCNVSHISLLVLSTSSLTIIPFNLKLRLESSRLRYCLCSDTKEKPWQLLCSLQKKQQQRNH